MLVAPVASAVASAVLLTVVGQCARNMIETVQVQQLAIADASSDNNNSDDKLIRNPLLESLSSKSETGLADRIRTMKRRDLLHLFASSRAPTSLELSEWFSSKDSKHDDDYSEWDAMLLDNNKGATTYATAFITHNLFGGISLPWRLLGDSSLAKGRWNGKAFAKPTTTSGRGTNRFAGRDATKNPRNFLRHDFDYEVVSSKIVPGDALRLDYSKYQSLPISLWWSMRDEVRVVEASLDSNDADDVVLIGMGWMGWSGGALNCSPFLLERSRK